VGSPPHSSSLPPGEREDRSLVGVPGLFGIWALPGSLRLPWALLPQKNLARNDTRCMDFRSWILFVVWVLSVVRLLAFGLHSMGLLRWLRLLTEARWACHRSPTARFSLVSSSFWIAGLTLPRRRMILPLPIVSSFLILKVESFLRPVGTKSGLS
jgi:hypothetical protein